MDVRPAQRNWGLAQRKVLAAVFSVPSGFLYEGAELDRKRFGAGDDRKKKVARGEVRVRWDGREIARRGVGTRRASERRKGGPACSVLQGRRKPVFWLAKRAQRSRGRK